ncbi:MAG: T9SS type A sorting domain-containing protein [Bacteroidetes bacterium]|nr:MAG: T9SS type A sorting domain-containing protein [Bacteroidota bacterium]
MLKKKYFAVILFIAFSGLINAQEVKLEAVSFSPGLISTSSGNINAQFALGIPIAGRAEASGATNAELGILFSSDEGVSSVDDLAQFNGGITLMQNYPNPSINYTAIEFIDRRDNPESCDIIVQNSLGQEIERFSLIPKPGMNTISINTERYPSGVYEYIIQSGNETDGRKMVVVK